MRPTAPWLAALLAVFALPAMAADKLRPDLASLEGVPLLSLPQAAVARGLEAASQRKGEPLQFAVRVPLAAGLAEGRWDTVDEHTARWRLQLRSPGAYSLHVHFDEFRVPDGAELWFYDSQGQLVQGPFTRAQENADGRLATALVLGERAVVELRVPMALKEQVRLRLGEGFHGYADIRKAGGGPAAKAGACERDVACPEGEPWSQEIRSVVRLQTGQFLCSGQLLNNARQDDTPFLVTANHCGVDAGNASGLVAYFNFQRPACGSGNGSLEQFVSGATLRRNHPDSDFTLVVLNTRPSSTFNAYYSGWDASGEDVPSGAGIHHPQGDEKSISLFDSPARKIENACTAQAEGGGCLMVVDSWEVGWRSGVTEQGSSGSGLWNPQRRLVGVLSGGSSNCNGSSGNGGTDFYGRFDAAWNAGGLKAELDPDNTGVTAIDGKSAAFGTSAAARAEPARFGGALGAAFSLLGLWAVLRRRYR